MKITDLKTLVVGNPWKNWIYVKLETDDGLIGWGESTGGLTAAPEKGLLEELRSRVIGLDPTNVTGVLDFLRKTLFLTSGGSAVSGIEMACWDIIAKKANMPLWQLLGGKVRPHIRCYANGWYQGPREPERFAERAQEIVAMGYTALKFDPFGKAYKFMSRDEELYAMKIVRAVRGAVGDEVDLLIEAHDRFNQTEAIRIGQMLEEFRPFWYETPVISDNFDRLNEVARRVHVPVIAGERTSNPRSLVKLLAGGAIDIVNPEILGCGGIIGLLDCFAIARSFDAYVAPHNAQSPFCTAVNVHVDITQPNLLIQECFDDSSVGWTDDVLSGYPKVVNGFIEPSDAPGIGVTINEKEAAKHPYGDKNFLWMFEDGWEKREGNK
ncbi:MAG: mandelate racemase/muconate lactonizing enzyme family protein [Eubacteriales bacterium]|nr:mandelate racemase/muconate lactonizing enzyme family protein [Eubacteriales bacterium]